MWKNYLNISFRNILKHKKISLINIFGLAAGIASSIIIFAYVNNELSYDKFHKNKDDIYRVTTHLNMGDRSIILASATPALGQQLKDEYPEIKNYVRLRLTEEFSLKVNNQKFEEKNLFYADSTFFDIFTYKLAVGNPKKVLNAPFSILLSEELAIKYFGNENPIGKKLKINNKDEFTVTGILKNIPKNTQIFCEYLASYSTIDAKNKQAGITQAGFMQFQGDYVYLHTKPNINIEQISEKINALVDENVPDHFKPIYNISLTPLKDLYFSEGISGEHGPVGNKEYIWIFLIITGILVLIAAINFMNLSTSRYIHRVREVGMRKVFGAYRKHLVFQFIGESMIITIIALIIGIAIAHLVNPALNNFIGKSLEVSFLSDVKLFGFLLFITVFIGFISGSYPAFFLSKFSPQDVFKINNINGDNGINLRRLLVIVQFTIASVLITFTIFIFSQIRYAKNAELGFNNNNLAFVSIQDKTLMPRFETFKNELYKIAGIEDICCASNLPGDGSMAMQNIPLEEDSEENILVQRIETDNEYLSTMQMKMVDGRFFSDDFASDQTESIILNETAVKELNLINPIGKTISLGNNEKRTVIGIIKDFNGQSLKSKISPMIFIPKQPVTEDKYMITGTMGIRINENKTEETLAAIQATWEKLFPEIEYKYEFLEDAYNRQYSSDIKMGKLFLFFSGLIILISCLGIYGLASFSIEKRIKEIGIRKILGGSLKNISILLSKQFLIWVLISYAIAIPFIYYFVDEWLKNFAYRIDINWHQFLIGIITIVTIALLTVLIQTIKASKTNPAEVLRYE